MSQVQLVFTFLAPSILGAWAMARALKLAGIQWRGPAALAGVLAVTSAAGLVPVSGLPLARWLAGIVEHWSVPLLALALADLVRLTLGRELLRGPDRNAAWYFGAAGAVLFYPMALGAGPFDPYTLGWRFGPLFAGMAVLASVLVWRQNRFGVVLIVAAGLWHAGIAASDNYWDCLLDPIYAVVSLGAVGWNLLVTGRRAQPGLSA